MRPKRFLQRIRPGRVTNSTAPSYLSCWSICCCVGYRIPGRKFRYTDISNFDTSISHRTRFCPQILWHPRIFLLILERNVSGLSYRISKSYRFDFSFLDIGRYPKSIWSTTPARKGRGEACPAELGDCRLGGMCFRGCRGLGVSISPGFHRRLKSWRYFYILRVCFFFVVQQY